MINRGERFTCQVEAGGDVDADAVDYDSNDQAASRESRDLRLMVR